MYIAIAIKMYARSLITLKQEKNHIRRVKANDFGRSVVMLLLSLTPGNLSVRTYTAIHTDVLFCLGSYVRRSNTV